MTISWGAVVVAAFLLAFLIMRVVSLLASPTVNFTDLGMVLRGAPVPQDQELPEHVLEMSSSLSSMTVAELPLGIRWLLVAESVLRATLGLGMCLAAFILPRRLLAGRPFDRTTIGVLFTVTVSVLVSGAIAPFLHAIAESETLRFITDGTFTTDVDTGFSANGGVIFGVQIDLAPWGIALGMAALLAAFEAGSRMQRETEGLV